MSVHECPLPVPYYTVDAEYAVLARSQACAAYFPQVQRLTDLVDADSLSKI